MHHFCSSTVAGTRKYKRSCEPQQQADLYGLESLRQDVMCDTMHIMKHPRASDIHLLTAVIQSQLLHYMPMMI